VADERISTPWGEFIGPSEDIIVSTLKAHTLWDGQGFLQPLCKEWARFGEVGTTVLDVGAHFGYFSVWLARQGAWRVVSVEPMPETYRYLQMNLDLNKDVCAGSVIPLPVGAYSQRTVLQPSVLDYGNWGGRFLTPVVNPGLTLPVYPLDDYQFLLGQRVSLIKCDAQGCDGAALFGLRQVIKRDHPVIIFEWDAVLAAFHGIPLQQTINDLTTRNYQTWEWPTHPNNYVAIPR
jgi:FkbM family methyltransferase